MPIKGLTDTLRMPRAGKIHLGLKSVSQQGAEYPTPTDYFVCPEEVIAALGDNEPRELNIMFPTEEPEQFAPTFLKFFSRTRGLVCKGDGEKADRTVNMKAILGTDGVIDNIPNTAEAWPVVDRDAKPEDIGRHTIECLADQCPQYGNNGCGRMMMLQFLLPDVPGLGIYQIDTGSRNGIQNIYGGIELVRAIVGHVAMVPLKLRIGPIQTQSPDTGKMQTNYVMSLHCDLTMSALSQYKAMGPGPDISTRQLPDPDDEFPDYLVAAELPDQSYAEDMAQALAELPEGQANGQTDLGMPADAPPMPRVHESVAEAIRAARDEVMAPPRPAPAPQTPKPTVEPEAKSDYDKDVWSLTVAQMGQRLTARRNELGITPEVLKEKANAIGLEKPQEMKPDQFMALMDWMQETYGHKEAGYADTLTDLDAGHISGALRTQESAPEIQEQNPVGDENSQGSEENESFEDLLNGISDDYTWEQTLMLASRMGIMTRRKLETEVMKMTSKEWDKLEGTAASAAKRLMRDMIDKRDAEAVTI